MSSTESNSRPQEQYIHLRPTKVCRKNKKGEEIYEYMDSKGLTICYHFEERGLRLGWSICSDRERSWNRKQARAIARSRMQSQPLWVHTEEPKLGGREKDRYVMERVRTYIAVLPDISWRQDGQESNGTRFVYTWVWDHGAFSVDTASSESCSHWSSRVPAWVHGLLYTACLTSQAHPAYQPKVEV